MTNFSNMLELMNHLTQGGAITNMDDSCKECWISFYKGNLCYPDRKEPVTNLGDPKNYRPVPVQWLTDSIHNKTPKLKE
jgi:hypothetical protein